MCSDRYPASASSNPICPPPGLLPRAALISAAAFSARRSIGSNQVASAGPEVGPHEEAGLVLGQVGPVSAPPPRLERVGLDRLPVGAELHHRAGGAGVQPLADQPVRQRVERAARLRVRVRGDLGTAPRRQLERQPGAAAAAPGLARRPASPPGYGPPAPAACAGPRCRCTSAPRRRPSPPASAVESDEWLRVLRRAARRPHGCRRAPARARRLVR